MGVSSRDATGEQLQLALDDAAESDPIHSFHKSALIRRGKYAWELTSDY